MKTFLFVNAAFRDGSRTAKLAEAFLKTCEGNVVEVNLGTQKLAPLTEETLRIYNESVAEHRFEHPMFDYAKQFVEADEIVIAAPFWNYSIPAVLHDYLELVCTQGISFDIAPDGTYFSPCKAKKLTYLTTAGGYIPEEDHAFGYIRSLAEVFWKIPETVCIKAEGLDIYGTDVDQVLEGCIASMNGGKRD